MRSGRWTTLAMTLVLVAAISGLVMWLRATAPAPTSDVAVELPSDDNPLACVDLEGPEGATIPQAPATTPIGRAVSGEVLGCPYAFDQKLVTYVGEVVGDVLARDGGSWLLVNDDAYALEDGPLTAGGTPAGTNSGLTVWLPDPMDDIVDEPGVHNVRGDVIEVVGRVHRTDPADGGGLTIRAEDARIVAEAAQVEVPVHWRQVGVAAVLSVLALLMLWRERERRAT